MHTEHGGWEESNQVWDAPRAARRGGEEVREAPWWPGLWEEAAAQVGELCWAGPGEDWGASR